MASNTDGSTRAIFYALGANGGIAIAKFVAAMMTGSGAMLAEAIHSLADCTNQIFLLIGLKETKKPIDEGHLEIDKRRLTLVEDQIRRSQAFGCVYRHPQRRFRRNAGE